MPSPLVGTLPGSTTRLFRRRLPATTEAGLAFGFGAMVLHLKKGCFLDLIPEAAGSCMCVSYHEQYYMLIVIQSIPHAVQYAQLVKMGSVR